MEQQNFLPFPECKVDIIYCDPPWEYKTNTGKKGLAQQHYKCVKTESLYLLKEEIDKISNKDCALLMWVTNPKIEDGLKLMKEWNFKYKTVLFVWIKTYKDGKPVMGLGNYTRSCTELLLLGTRGKLFKWVKNKSILNIIYSIRREHSRKPDEMFEKIIQLFGNREKIELFSREPREGWYSWGNETNKFNKQNKEGWDSWKKYWDNKSLLSLN